MQRTRWLGTFDLLAEDGDVLLQLLEELGLLLNEGEGLDSGRHEVGRRRGREHVARRIQPLHEEVWRREHERLTRRKAWRLGLTNLVVDDGLVAATEATERANGVTQIAGEDVDLREDDV